MVPPSPGLVELLRGCVGPEGGAAGGPERNRDEWLALINRVGSRGNDAPGDFPESWKAASFGKTPAEGKIAPSSADERDFLAEVEALMTAAPSLLWGSAHARQATETYITRLVRRFCFWREMLKDYFGIIFTDDGEYLMGLPYGLNTSWAPYLRAVPLFLWLLADAVPYPSPRLGEDGSPELPRDANHLQYQEREVEAEIRCFTSIARYIADILYGLMPPTDEAQAGDVSSAGLEGLEAARARGGGFPANLSHPPSPTSMGDGVKNSPEGAPTSLNKLSDHIRFGLFPSMRNKKLFIPPADLLIKGDIQSVVTVETLYKVFERC
ncbi:unnamed protein product [Phytomonas sp. Hart1]|nr:unnamed protein product [Phytomonas sp. Hart1]|eukprot:CCW65981.1 unnamed protein product [Phytomonas sp. isolate Hart1]